MKLFVRMVVLTVVACCSSASFAAEENPRFERRVLASHKDVEWNRYPSMARLDDGRLMVVWYSSKEYRETPNAKKNDRIVVTYSSDHGRTWSAPMPLIRTPGHDFDPSILVSGKRVFVTATVKPDGPGITTSATWCTRSDDNGKTWSDLYQIPMNHRYTCGKTQHGLRLKSGTLLFGYSWDIFCEQGKTVGDEDAMHLRAGVMRSTDNGQTWHNGGDTDAKYEKASASAVLGTDEPAIVELENGSVYMLMRTGSTHLFEARSFDEGKTWTQIGPSPLRGTNAPSALCQFKIGQRRGILCVWDNARTRFPLCAAASFDGGKTWSKPKDIAGPTGGRQASYPDCYQAADGILVAVWQQGVPGGRDVRFARFNLAWLLQETSQKRP